MQAVDLGKQKGVQTSSRPVLAGSAAPAEAGHVDSQAALNADLMLNNIYKSGEFADNEDELEKLNTKKDQEDGGGPAPALLKGRLDSKSSLDMKEGPEGSLASAGPSVADVGQQVAIATATSRELTPAT